MIFSKLVFLSILTVVYACSHESNVLNTTLNVADSPAQNMEVESPVNVIYQSSDVGKSWQDISQGLTPNIQAPEFYADETDLYILGVKDIFHGIPSATGIVWQKENFMDYHNNFVKIKGELISYTSDGEIRKKSVETNEWKPIFPNFGEKNVRLIFESSEGTVLIGCDHGLFKTSDDGKTWKLVHDEGWVIKIAESANGVLIATGEKGIMRSSDGGDNWNWVIQEGGVGIDVEPIKNGFVAITYNGASETRRIRASFDQGATWQLIDNDLPPSANISSVIQMGENFFCGHTDGIYASADKGKTWKLILPSVEDKVFDLSVSGNMMYAIPRFAGC
jgi:photosystem II stability/assembly factor-like uncharacterized protein